MATTFILSGCSYELCDFKAYPIVDMHKYEIEEYRVKIEWCKK